MRQFQFTNYTPRKEFEYYANFELDQIAELMPCYSAVHAESTRAPDGFRFLVCFRSLCGTFSAEATVRPDVHLHHDRMWQKPAIEQVVRLLKQQIRHWHEKRSVSAAGAA